MCAILGLETQQGRPVHGKSGHLLSFDGLMGRWEVAAPQEDVVHILWIKDFQFAALPSENEEAKQADDCLIRLNFVTDAEEIGSRPPIFVLDPVKRSILRKGEATTEAAPLVH